jgi:hypothetical protein
LRVFSCAGACDPVAHTRQLAGTAWSVPAAAPGRHCAAIRARGPAVATAPSATGEYCRQGCSAANLPLHTYHQQRVHVSVFVAVLCHICSGHCVKAWPLCNKAERQRPLLLQALQRRRDGLAEVKHLIADAAREADLMRPVAARKFSRAAAEVRHDCMCHTSALTLLQPAANPIA